MVAELLERTGADTGGDIGAGRVMVVWCPDWPVIAAAAEAGLPAGTPVAVIGKGAVLACSPAARTEGVRRGMRKRDASAHCPELVVVDDSPERDLRYFDQVLAAVEEVDVGRLPDPAGTVRDRGAEPVLRWRARGGRRARRTAGRGRCVGLPDRGGRRHLRRRAGGPSGRTAGVPGGRAPGTAPAFLAGLPIGVIEDADMVSLLRRLGIRDARRLRRVCRPGTS